MRKPSNITDENFKDYIDSGTQLSSFFKTKNAFTILSRNCTWPFKTSTSKWSKAFLSLPSLPFSSTQFCQGRGAINLLVTLTFFHSLPPTHLCPCSNQALFTFFSLEFSQTLFSDTTSGTTLAYIQGWLLVVLGRYIVLEIDARSST